MRKYFVICISVIIVLGTLSLGTGCEGVNDEKEFESEDEEYISEDIYQKSDEEVESLDENIQKEVSSRSEDELIEVVLRLRPYNFDDFEGSSDLEFDRRGTEYVSALKEYSREQQSEIKKFLEEGTGEVINTFWIANAILVEVEVGELDKLAEFEQIWKVHENFEVDIDDSYPLKFPVAESSYATSEVQANKTSDNETWGLDRINVSEVWDGGEIWEQGYNGSGVKVAVSDTGVDIEHPDLEGKMMTIDEDDPHYPGGWIEIDEDGEIVEDSNPHEQHTGHGTHVSGTVVGGNASGRNIGVAPGVDLMHVGIYSSLYPVLSQLLATLEWKLEPRDRHGKMLNETYGGDIEDYRPDVASMSWGGDYEEYRSEFEEPIQNLRRAGIVPVTSMGNSGEGTIGTPGSIYEDIAVGASNSEDDISEFSSGDIVEDGRDDTPDKYVKPDFAAPGVEVNSSVPEDKWGEKWVQLSGTSMATPHVAGTVALMLDANPELTVDEIYEALKISADYQEAGESLFQERKNTRYGHGIINADKAVDYVSGLGIREPEDLTNEEAVLKAEVLEMPEDIDELEVFFRYREKGEDDWLSTERESISKSQEFVAEVVGLNSGTTYEYEAVAQLDDKEETTFSLTFTTHKDVETLTCPAEINTLSSATLKGEVTHLYREKAEVFFRYRRKDKDEWIRTESININKPVKFEKEIDGLESETNYEYRLEGVSNGDEFIGNLIEFNTYPPLKPEWNEEKKAYLISNVGELQWMKNDLESDYILKNRIDASDTRNWYQEKGFQPIGDNEHDFNGTFDGNGHKIKHLYINRSDTNDVGLFEEIDKGGYVKKVGLTELEVYGDDRVGGLVGTNSGTVEKSFAAGNASGDTKIGALAGSNTGTLSNSYAKVGVNGTNQVGGLAGSNYHGTVKNSYATGEVNGEKNIGGLVGWKSESSVENSFWNIDTTGEMESDNGMGKTILEMKDVATYTDTDTEGLGEPWDFKADPYDDEGDEDIWNIDPNGRINDGYPFLDWEEEHGEYELNIFLEGEGTVEIKNQNVGDGWAAVFEEGEIIELTAEPGENLYFDGWTGDYGGEEKEITIAMDEDKSVTANFKVKEYTLKVNTVGEGDVEIESDQTKYEHGEEVTLTAIPEDGWQFVGWEGDVPEDEEGEEINITMNEDKIITAHFEEEEEIPGFTSMILLAAIVIVVAIYKRSSMMDNV